MGPAQTECRPIMLAVHQELGVMTLRVQSFNYWDVLIEFDSIMDVEQVDEMFLRMEWWMGAQFNLEYVPTSYEDSLWEFRGGNGCPQMDTEWIDPPWRGQIIPTVAADQPHPKMLGSPNSWRTSRLETIS